jgi:hypothetical protein
LASIISSLLPPIAIWPKDFLPDSLQRLANQRLQRGNYISPYLARGALASGIRRERTAAASARPAPNPLPACIRYAQPLRSAEALSELDLSADSSQVQTSNHIKSIDYN